MANYEHRNLRDMEKKNAHVIHRRQTSAFVVLVTLFTLDVSRVPPCHDTNSKHFQYSVYSVKAKNINLIFFFLSKLL